MKSQPQTALAGNARIHMTLEMVEKLGSCPPMLCHWLWTNTTWGLRLVVNSQAQNGSLKVAKRGHWPLAIPSKAGAWEHRAEQRGRRGFGQKSRVSNIPNQRLQLPALLFSAGRGSSLLIGLCSPHEYAPLQGQMPTSLLGILTLLEYPGDFSHYLLTQSGYIAYSSHTGLQDVFLKTVPLMTLKYLSRRLLQPQGD